MNKIFFCILLANWPAWLFAQSAMGIPADVKMVLDRASSNRRELEKAISYFSAKKDPLKLKALYFLIGNMEGHQSFSYYWAGKSNQKLAFNEFDYKNYNEALRAFEVLKKNNPGIHPVRTTYRDMDSVRASLLIENIEEAFKAWRSPYSQHLPFEAFCEYILPYRIGIEPLQQWRAHYAQRFSRFTQSGSSKTLMETLNGTGPWFRNWFTITGPKETRKEPLPRLGALQLLSRAKGSCEDVADLQIFMLRSQGIPVSLDFIPYWSTSSGSHFFNVVHDRNGRSYMYDPAQMNALNNFEKVGNMRLPREPGKVLRVTYGRQQSTLAYNRDTTQIPSGFLQSQHYIDVTDQYWKTVDVTCKVNNPVSGSSIAYASVFNYGKWRTVWWGNIQHGKVAFLKLSAGTVYLPSVYKKGKHTVIGYPVAISNNEQTELKPDHSKPRTVSIRQQPNYLLFRIGKRYRLHYWDNEWKLLGEKTAGVNTEELVFEKVPENALLILIPEYTEHKERPFTIGRDGNRQWW